MTSGGRQGGTEGESDASPPFRYATLKEARAVTLGIIEQRED